MIASPRLVLEVFMELGENELRELRNGAFSEATTGSGTIVQSSVNGSSFTFSAPSFLSKMEIIQFAQLALKYKTLGITSPLSRTTASFA